ncbi:MAG TPA: DUF1501 domain-containing protein [Gemmatimonadales bacterium]|nr:DUF1501 domain-containing protein [Usitatibacter sp.]
MKAPSSARRRLLKALAAAPVAIHAPRLFAESAPRRLFVMVYLYGGNDGYNTWVPYTDETYYRVRPNIAVARDSVLKVTGTHGFHPSLASLVPAWEAQELALVQGVGYAEVTQQHYRDEEIAFTGCDGEILGDGWVTRALAGKRRGAQAPDAFALDMLDTRQADPMGPFRGERLGVVEIHHPGEFLEKRDFRQCVTTVNTPGAHRLAQLKPAAAVALKTQFPDDPFGRAMRAAVELAAREPEVPVIHVTLNGLDDDKHHSVDCHWEQVKYHGDALRRLAEGLAALRAGLVETGRWNDTLVATYDEFGRSPMENEDRGTHHGLANTHFVMGGRVRGGLHGEAPKVQRLYPIGGVAPAIDTRRVWATVVERWWGGRGESVFGPGYRPLDLLRA